MVGLETPILVMEHQYLITEDLLQLKGCKEQRTASTSRATKKQA
jgi:hypothetical protein